MANKELISITAETPQSVESQQRVIYTPKATSTQAGVVVPHPGDFMIDPVDGTLRNRDNLNALQGGSDPINILSMAKFNQGDFMYTGADPNGIGNTHYEVATRKGENPFNKAVAVKLDDEWFEKSDPLTEYSTLDANNQEASLTANDVKIKTKVYDPYAHETPVKFSPTMEDFALNADGYSINRKNQFDTKTLGRLHPLFFEVGNTTLPQTTPDTVTGEAYNQTSVKYPIANQPSDILTFTQGQGLVNPNVDSDHLLNYEGDQLVVDKDKLDAYMTGNPASGQLRTDYMLDSNGDKVRTVADLVAAGWTDAATYVHEEIDNDDPLLRTKLVANRGLTDNELMLALNKASVGLHNIRDIDFSNYPYAELSADIRTKIENWVMDTASPSDTIPAYQKLHELFDDWAPPTTLPEPTPQAWLHTLDKTTDTIISAMAQTNIFKGFVLDTATLNTLYPPNAEDLSVQGQLDDPSQLPAASGYGLYDAFVFKRTQAHPNKWCAFIDDTGNWQTIDPWNGVVFAAQIGATAGNRATQTYWQLNGQKPNAAWTDTGVAFTDAETRLLQMMEVSYSAYQEDGDVANAGASGKWAQSDHQHPIRTDLVAATKFGSTILNVDHGFFVQTATNNFTVSLYDAAGTLNRVIAVPYTKETEAVHNWNGQNASGFQPATQFADAGSNFAGQALKQWYGSKAQFNAEFGGVAQPGYVYHVDDDYVYVDGVMVTRQDMIDYVAAQITGAATPVPSAGVLYVRTRTSASSPDTWTQLPAYPNEVKTGNVNNIGVYGTGGTTIVDSGSKLSDLVPVNIPQDTAVNILRTNSGSKLQVAGQDVATLTPSIANPSVINITDNGSAISGMVLGQNDKVFLQRPTGDGTWVYSTSGTNEAFQILDKSKLDSAYGNVTYANNAASTSTASGTVSNAFAAQAAVINAKIDNSRIDTAVTTKPNDTTVPSTKAVDAALTALQGTLAPVATAGTFASLTGKPTTVAGYGITNAVTTAMMGTVNGVATLGADGKIPVAQIPDQALGQLVHAGEFDATTAVAVLTADGMYATGATTNIITLTNDTTAVTGYTSNQNCYYIVAIAGSFAGTAFNVGDWLIANSTGWYGIINTDQVQSVNGHIGVVQLVPADIGLGNVNNTSDMDKPVSTAVTSALGNYVGKTSADTISGAKTFNGNVTVGTASNFTVNTSVVQMGNLGNISSGYLPVVVDGSGNVYKGPVNAMVNNNTINVQYESSSGAFTNMTNGSFTVNTSTDNNVRFTVAQLQTMLSLIPNA